MKNLLAALALIAAVNANAQVKAAQKTWMEGQHSGVTEPMAVAVQDPAKWEEIWRQHDASGAPAPDVDFSKQNVIVVFLGKTETAGVKVTIVVQQDPIDSSRINVFYRETVIKKGFAAQVECQPYAMVKVPRAATIDVEKDGKVSVPERANAPAAPKHDDKRVKALMDSIQPDSVSFN